ncbi:MAG: hypothetical protein K2X82_22350 [Gemmataceae bacterium]|nr:hypothetical protein [Gemmataceae bacterium]
MEDECWAVRDWLFMWTDRGESAERIVADARRQGVRLDSREVALYLSRLRRAHRRSPSTRLVATLKSDRVPA